MSVISNSYWQMRDKGGNENWLSSMPDLCFYVFIKRTDYRPHFPIVSRAAIMVIMLVILFAPWQGLPGRCHVAHMGYIWDIRPLYVITVPPWKVPCTGHKDSVAFMTIGEYICHPRLPSLIKSLIVSMIEIIDQAHARIRTWPLLTMSLCDEWKLGDVAVKYQMKCL